MGRRWRVNASSSITRKARPFSSGPTPEISGQHGSSISGALPRCRRAASGYLPVFAKTSPEMTEHPWKIGATDWDAVKAWLRKDVPMTYWRTPRDDAPLRHYRAAWLTFTASLFLGAVACLVWGLS